ncbi:MAG TPA: phage tail sheath subtilisin-like domain-containing protein, partial [Pyrinomonadaceae bacterium]
RLPTANSYRGSDTGATMTGLFAFEGVDEISIVAAPGYSYQSTQDAINNDTRASQITSHLLTHVEKMRYRVAVLDSPDGFVLSEVRNFRGKFDSKHAALYYPWVTVGDPNDPDGVREIELPPSGFVAGIYARNDVEHGVFKAPANEVVRGAIGFETLLNKSQQDVLNPEGINCFRFFEGRGYRLWGARTISSDPEWKYISVRRYFAYLEHSVDKGTQWAVFENNNEPLWANIRRTVEDFLFNEWRGGALMGAKPEEAYFVRCDRSTMTQNDLDNGRLICLVGVAVVKPAEFVIFRIGQWTADRKV